MEESEDNMSSEDARKLDGQSAVKKPKKRSMVERELETNMTARVTSPAAVAEGLSTSRYGRARRLKTETELIESQKILLASLKSPGNENNPVGVQSPVYRMHASNSPQKTETHKKALVTYLDNQIDNIYQENISLSRFSDETSSPSPAKKFPKVYIRKDLIQNREEEETVMLIKNLFSPSDIASKPSDAHMSDSSVHSTEKYSSKQNGLVDNRSVVKTLDFDSNKKRKKDDKEQKGSMSKNELFDLEAKCPYQVGDLGWARVGSFPFWPCLVTRDPYSEMFVKTKLFGRVEHDIIHVTFFGDNGRRSWIVDNMLRKYLGLQEFESAREKFTPEDKKKDPRLYAAFFVSEKKQALWNMSVEEAEVLLREPKRLRIEIFNDMLWKSRASKKPLKSGKICTRTNSDVSLSESLYDSLFSETEVKDDDVEHSKKPRNKSFDVSEVVTACLDNMAAKTGITKIQKQSHMDRWLQKAKSKTPEKTLAKSTVVKLEKSEKVQTKPSASIKLTKKSNSKSNTKPVPSSPSVSLAKPYRFRKKTESHSKSIKNKNNLNIEGSTSQITIDNKSVAKSDDIDSTNTDINENDNNSSQDESKVFTVDEDNTIQPKNEPIAEYPEESLDAMDTVDVKQVKSVTDKVYNNENLTNSSVIDSAVHGTKTQVNIESNTKESSDILTIIKQDNHNLGMETLDPSITSFQVKNELNAKTTTKLIQDTKPQPSKSIEKAEETTSTSIDNKFQNVEAKSTEPMETSLESSDISIEANSKLSVSDVKCQDHLMNIDENTRNAEIVQDKSVKPIVYEPVNNSVMEVDEYTYFQSEAKEEASPNSKTVSKKSVGNNVVTDLTEARNVVTIEVSVTEKKNDDTLKNLHEGEQESIKNLNLSQLTGTKLTKLNFLDESNNVEKGSTGTNDIIAKKKSSTILSKKVNLESKSTYSNFDNIIRNEVKLQDNSNKSFTKNLLMENSTTNCRNDALHENGNSESIKQFSADDPGIEKHKTILEASFSDNMKSDYILESSQKNKDVNGHLAIEEIAENAENNCYDKTEMHQNDSIRQYVESPTFTQLLESEEFFRDVNETHYNSTSLDSEKSKQYLEPQERTAIEFESNTKNNKNNEVIGDLGDDEDTSEDEPSPEYESLDDEITEDFRKHMMSIESNIKDKKDEEQIVKICNEIAEKAKLSPTKYTEDEQMEKVKFSTTKYTQNEVMAKTDNKPTRNSRSMALINHKGNNDVKPKSTLIDDHHVKVDKHCRNLLDKLDSSIEKQNKSFLRHAAFTKGLNRSDKQTRTDIQPDVFPNKNKDCRIHNQETNLKMNGNATLHEISDNPNIIYRTRSSVSSVSKECASPDIKLESSIVDQYRKSCEYEPKVVIIRLERDKINYSTETSKSMLLGDDKSRISPSDSHSSKYIDNKILENEEVKSKNRKSRLSLRRDSPKTKQTDNIQNKSKNLTEKEIKKEELDMTATILPKKIKIVNDDYETGIPEPFIVNGYHHDLGREHTDTPDLVGDTDFDVDDVSLNSEDSEVSLPNPVESISKRNLRPRSERTLENALKNPEFLKYLELRQDYVMDIHPELNEDEVVSYVYKTWQYEEDLKTDTKKMDDVHNKLKQETPSRSKKSKNVQPKNSIENHFREKNEKSRKTINFDEEPGVTANSMEVVNRKVELNLEESNDKRRISVNRKKRSKSPDSVDLTIENSEDTSLVKNKCTDVDIVSVKPEKHLTPKRTSRSTMAPKNSVKQIFDIEDKSILLDKLKKEHDGDTDSVDSGDSEIPLRQLRSRVLKENNTNEFKKEASPEKKVDEVSSSKEPIINKAIKVETDDTASTVSDNEPLVKQKKKRIDNNSLKDPGFIQYLEQRRNLLMDENPQLSQEEVVQYLHKTWLYEESSKSVVEKNNEFEQQGNLVKGLNNNEDAPSKKIRRKPKVEKQEVLEVSPREKPRRRVAQPFYNENYSDIEEELEVFEIFKTKKSAITVVSKAETQGKSPKSSKQESPKVTSQTEGGDGDEYDEEVQYVDDTERYFTELTQPKPNIFKGLVREKVCDICECAGSLVKCKGCYGMFHPDCVKKLTGPKVEKDKESDVLLKGRKKKRKSIRKQKSLEDSESHSDDKSHDVSADSSVDDIIPPEICTIDADDFESHLEVKMKEIIIAPDINYDSYSSDDGIDWTDSVAGKCEIVDVKLKRRDPPVDYSDYKCHNCRQHDVPVCFVCRSAVSKSDVKVRQKCNVAHCHKYYHLECLDHWPQTQFNSGEPSRGSKKKSEFLESLSCPRHVCHSCVSDDPRGCKTRFSGDKLARCVRCPATYHSFTKCLPAGSRVLSASHVVCPRHVEQKAGKIPCHVNTGWCFICALGGSLICCEYCPTSFHAECLNIKPPEGNYMCEDCETGRLPLYGEMVWVKLGQYRWWPALVLHPAQVPDNIMCVKHELGDFVVRFFGQYDHFWVNRGRVFPYQEGDSGRISSQKSKINADFILAMEHAQRAYKILKSASVECEESLDILSSLLPPHYVKLRSNQPRGSLCGRREDPSLSLTQCECSPAEQDPCGPYSQCLNRMLLTECGPSCRAGERCNNRAFERRLYPRLAPHRTKQRGWGLKTLEHIKAGQFVIEYVGELIDEEEFRRRMRRKHEVRDENYYFLTLDKERVIDAGPKGNVARFMNHCCEPNCETQKWTVLGDVRVGLFAIDDIPADSEVTFNYNLQCAGIEKKRCLCGAPRCSGYIGAKPKQDESQSKKAKDGKVKRTYNKKKKPEESPSTSKIKKKLGRPPKPKELTELEKDVLIIKNATNSSSSDECSKTEDPTSKRKTSSISTDEGTLCNGPEEDKTKSLKRKRVSISTEEVSICNGQEPCVKKQRCDGVSEVGD